VFANPLVCSALAASRDGTSDPDDPVRTPLQAPFDKPENITRWEPWVRSHVLQWELCKGVDVVASGGVGAEKVELKADNQVIATLNRPDVSYFKDQLPLVLSWADLRVERTPEILAQIDNQFAFVAAITGLHPERHRFTVEFLVNAIQFTVLVEMQFKHKLACWRPHQYSAQVQPMITTPGHGSFPSGHSTQAFVLARLMDAIFPDKPANKAKEFEGERIQLYRQAARIACNRVIAGVHFPVDSVAGRLLGHSIAEYILARLGQSNIVGNTDDVIPRSFTPTAAAAKTLDLDLADSVTAPGNHAGNSYTILNPVQVGASLSNPSQSALAKLWDLGAQERAAVLPPV
jgi:membrane-associated phospholipid phosphatase